MLKDLLFLSFDIYRFSRVYSQLVHFHFSKTSSPNEKGTKSPSPQTGHLGNILGKPSTSFNHFKFIVNRLRILLYISSAKMMFQLINVELRDSCKN